MAKQPRSSQALWTEGEALERAGKPADAMKLFAKAAVEEEDAGQPLRARILWEQIAKKAGTSGIVLERLALTCQKGKLVDEAFDYWLAAAATYHGEGRVDEAVRAKTHASQLRARVTAHDRAPLAAAALAGPAAQYVKELL
jgi:tetratricopeptide (TPR) repeat protein